MEVSTVGATTIVRHGGGSCSSTSSSSPAVRTSPRIRECASRLAFYIGAAVLFGPGSGRFAGTIRRRVLRRLADRVLAVRRQPVRLHHPHGHVAVPREYQQNALMVGIILALIFRGIFIALGAPRSTLQLGLLHLRAFLVYTAFTLGQGGLPTTRTSTRTTGREVRPDAPARHRRVARHEARRQGERQAADRADVHRGHDARHHRPAVRARLDPGDLRHHPGARTSSSPPTCSR